jgi:hypothetical protein
LIEIARPGVAAETVNITLACDTRLAAVLLEVLAPLVRRGVMDEACLLRIVTSAIRTVAVQD